MVKASQPTHLNSTTANCQNDARHEKKALKRTRKSVLRDTPSQRSSIYRGVTRHRWTRRYEAHLWDKDCWNEGQKKKGRQVYLGAYDEEEIAACAYDLAALKYWGIETVLNFPILTYQDELEEMEGQSREESIGYLRRMNPMENNNNVNVRNEQSDATHSSLHLVDAADSNSVGLLYEQYARGMHEEPFLNYTRTVPSSYDPTNSDAHTDWSYDQHSYDSNIDLSDGYHPNSYAPIDYSSYGPNPYAHVDWSYDSNPYSHVDWSFDRSQFQTGNTNYWSQTVSVRDSEEQGSSTNPNPSHNINNDSVSEFHNELDGISQTELSHTSRTLSTIDSSSGTTYSTLRYDNRAIENLEHQWNPHDGFHGTPGHMYVPPEKVDARYNGTLMRPDYVDHSYSYPKEVLRNVKDFVEVETSEEAHWQSQRQITQQAISQSSQYYCRLDHIKCKALEESEQVELSGEICYLCERDVSLEVEGQWQNSNVVRINLPVVAIMPCGRHVCHDLCFQRAAPKDHRTQTFSCFICDFIY